MGIRKRRSYRNALWVADRSASNDWTPNVPTVLVTFKSLKANLDNSDTPPTLTAAAPITTVPPVAAATAAPAATSFATF